MNLPRFHRVHQRLFSERLTAIPGTVRREINRVLPPLRPGAAIAITAGSRGVANIALILRAVCDEVRAAGGVPFLVPAMGSHGGATAPGQLALLAGLGVTEESVGAPIRASMDVVVAGYTPSGVEVYLDRIASEADGIVLVERIKPHTDFEGRWESGLAKMMAIGLGKQAGAVRIHSLGAKGLRELIPQVAEVMLQQAPIVAGLAVLENAIGETWRVEGVAPRDLLEREAEMLCQVKAHSAWLPFAEADVVLADYIGKEISGTGMDTKVIGRMRIAGEPEPTRPRIGCLAALDLTDASHGNAIGIGLADMTTERLLAKVDDAALRVNAIACGFWERAKLPVAVSNDREALQTALRLCARPVQEARVCRIRDTQRLDQFVVSEALLRSLEGDYQVGPEYTLAFDAQGNLADHNCFPEQVV